MLKTRDSVTTALDIVGLSMIFAGAGIFAASVLGAAAGCVVAGVLFLALSAVLTYAGKAGK